MRLVRLLFAGLAAAFLCTPSAVLAASTPPVPPSAKDLTRAAAVASVTIAPDGKHIAALSSPDGEVVDLVVWSTDNLAAPPTRIRATHMRFTSVRFLKNDRLLVSAVQPVSGGGDAPHDVRKNYVTDLAGKSFNSLLPGLETEEFDPSQLISSLPTDPKSVMVADAYSGDIYKVDVYAGSAGKVMHGSEKYFSYQVDLQGELRARQFADFDNGALYIAQQARDPASKQWVELFRSYAKDRKPTNIVGFTTDPNVILISTPQDGDKTAIYAYDVHARKILEQEFAHKLFDVGVELFPPQVIQSHDKADFGAVLGFTLLDQGYDFYWTDPRMQSVATALNQLLKVATITTDWTDPATGLRAKIQVPDGSQADIEAWSEDRRYIIVHKSGPHDPGEYYLLSDGAKLALLGRERPWIDPVSLGDTRLVEYTARDGLTIPAFLTVPPKTAFGAGPFPTLIEPHGGPWARDLMEWDSAGWVQYFASRGYAVLQPQFRGSDGWGQKLWRAGDREWGQKMQDDNDDGAKWLVDQHIADPKRIAIFGYSYGGYAALAASVRPRGIYQCAISGAGAGDLSRFVDATYQSRWGREFQMPTVAGLNPMAHAKDLQIPVLLYHGDHDTTVDPEESRNFAAAAKASGKFVKLVEIKDMGHQYDLMTPDMMLEQLNLVDGFLKSDCKPGGL